MFSKWYNIYHKWLKINTLEKFQFGKKNLTGFVLFGLIRRMYESNNGPSSHIHKSVPISHSNYTGVYASVIIKTK